MWSSAPAAAMAPVTAPTAANSATTLAPPDAIGDAIRTSAPSLKRKRDTIRDLCCMSPRLQPG